MRVSGIICVLAALFLTLNASAETKPKYARTTLKLEQHSDYIRHHRAPDFWAFMPYYVPQQDGRACGIASMTMFVNAARTHQKLSASDALITQKSFLEKTKVNYDRGLNLDQLGEAVKKSLKEYALPGTVEVIHADGKPSTNQKIKELLIKNEKTDQNLILANFAQSVYTGDPEGVGHISPVGAYDAQKQKVLILDVDREYYEPYWVSTDTFIAGLSTPDKSTNQNRGLVYVELK